MCCATVTADVRKEAKKKRARSSIATRPNHRPSSRGRYAMGCSVPNRAASQETRAITTMPVRNAISIASHASRPTHLNITPFE
jgi:hypothetical protein